MNNPVTGLPGVGSTRVSMPREILAGNAAFAQFVPGLRTIDGSKCRDALNSPDVDVIRAGTLMGKTTSGKYAVSVIGALTVAVAAGATSLIVAPSVATEIVRRLGASGNLKVTGPATAGGSVQTQSIAFSAVNVAVGIITVNATAAAIVAGSFIQATDGSEAPICILGNRWGVKCTDMSGVSVDVLEDQLLIAGHIKTANIINYPSDVSLIAWLKMTLRASCPALTFDDSF